MQNSYRLDLKDLADWLYLPMVELCRFGELEEPPEAVLLDLAELLFDFDLNSRLRWTNHNCRYREEDFKRLLPPLFFQNEELATGLDNLKMLVSDYVDERLGGFLGRLVNNDHVYESVRVAGWLWLIDLGKVKQSRRRMRMTEEQYAATVISSEATVRLVTRNGIRTLAPAPKPHGALPMNTINITISPRPNYQHHCVEDLTDEQLEWLAEVDRYRCEMAKHQRCKERTGATLRSGMRFQKKVRTLRAKLDRIRSNPNDLYINPNRDGFTFISTPELDDRPFHHTDTRSACPLRPIRPKRRANRNANRRKPTSGA